MFGDPAAGAAEPAWLAGSGDVDVDEGAAVPVRAPAHDAAQVWAVGGDGRAGNDIRVRVVHQATVCPCCCSLVVAGSTGSPPPVLPRGMTFANSREGPCRCAAAPPSPAEGGAGSVSTPAARMPLMVR